MAAAKEPAERVIRPAQNFADYLTLAARATGDAFCDRFDSGFFVRIFDEAAERDHAACRNEPGAMHWQLDAGTVVRLLKGSLGLGGSIAFIYRRSGGRRR